MSPLSIKQCVVTLLPVAASFVGVDAAATGKVPREDIIRDHSFFNGQSPPVYPSPEQSSEGPWADAHAKAIDLVSQWTLEEMANITVGYTPTNRCSGLTGSVPRLGWPGLCTTGAGNGIRQADFVNGWPSAIHVGASFNRNLTYQRAAQMGGEFRTKGSNMAGGPVIGPLGRMARHGRNWEGFSNDPYLAGQMAALTVQGIQDQGVMAMSKHFVGYEQQRFRQPNTTLGRWAVSSNMDDRTMHELYLWPFADAVHAGTASVMCSYNGLNNSDACQNSKALNGLLKTELGFQGWVISDWGAQRAGLASAEAGLDVAMPSSDKNWGVGGKLLVEMVRNGSLPEARVKAMAVRVVSAWYALGQDTDYPAAGVGLPLDFTAPRTPVYARDPASKKVLLDGAIEGHVLVKNVNGTLPLKKPKLLSIFGYDAPAPQNVNIPASPSLASKTGWIFGFTGADIEDYQPFLQNMFDELPAYASHGTLICGGGSGATAPAYISGPFEALQERAYQDDTALFWDFRSDDPAVSSASDACLVFINVYAGEGADRPNLHDDYSDGLVLNVARKCANTIVTIHNAGIRLVDQWIDHPNITAVIFAHLPGQDSGRAAVSVLYGDSNPSGKLPYTVGRNESDHEAVNPDAGTGRYELFPQSDFSEGIFLDYRHFDRNGIEPRFEFGFGLSYTTFEYSGLHIEQLCPECSRSRLPPPFNGTAVGGNPALWKTLASVSAVVRNTGSVDGAEAAQLYVGLPGDDVPIRQLRGFDKVFLSAGGEAPVRFDLTRRDLSYWDVIEQNWVLRPGEYKIYVGASSRDLRLEGGFTIE
ncbi:hypothetical protein CEP51_012658 [Fusarium floridanum]|uniref:Beta-glucosidase cel3A n=1 Tax=Fusarium floridanum TaxID=1325733 RepID=A0A428QQ27_9HYPO|nr:hypothetical protein CEP51_012658 [Fusarium floridanum]